MLLFYANQKCRPLQNVFLSFSISRWSYNINVRNDTGITFVPSYPKFFHHMWLDGSYVCLVIHACDLSYQLLPLAHKQNAAHTSTNMVLIWAFYSVFGKFTCGFLLRTYLLFCFMYEMNFMIKLISYCLICHE